MGLKRSRVERDKASPVLCEVCRKQPAPSNATPGGEIIHDQDHYPFWEKG